MTADAPADPPPTVAAVSPTLWARDLGSRGFRRGGRDWAHAATAGDAVELICAKGLAFPLCCARCDAARGALAAVVDAGHADPEEWAAAMVTAVSQLRRDGWAPHSPPPRPGAETRVEDESTPSPGPFNPDAIAATLRRASEHPTSPPDVELGDGYTRGTDGWRLPWASPARPTAPSRRRLRSHRDWVAIAVAVGTDLARGAAEVVNHESVLCFSPVRIEWQQGKPRLVVNLRVVNSFLTDETSVVYEYASRAVRLRAKVAAKLDLDAAFRHVSVAVEDRPYLGFCVGAIAMQYTALPFGLSHSPRMFARAMAPAINAIRERGVPAVIYVDDILVLASSEAELQRHVDVVIDSLHEFGWRLSIHKCFLRPMVVVRFLGLLVDLQAQTLRVPPSKAQRISEGAQLILDLLAATPCPWDDIVEAAESLAGVISFCAAAWPPCNCFRECFDAAVHCDERPPPPGVAASLLAQCRFWVDVATVLPSLHRPVCGPAASVLRGFGDASDTGWGGAVVATSVPLPSAVMSPDIGWEALHSLGLRDVAWGQWSPLEAVAASAVRELRSMHRCLLALRSVVGGAVVVWHCDATAAVAAVGRWGTSSDEMRRALRDLWDLLVSENIDFSVVWVRRELGWQPVGDFLTRIPGELNTSEWSLSAPMFTWVLRRVRELDLPLPALDAFATAANAKLPAFCSRRPEAGSLGSAEETSWPLATYAFPPITDAWRAVSQLGRSPQSRFLYLVAVHPLACSVPIGLQVLHTIPLSVSRVCPSQWLLPLSGVPQRAPPPWPLALVVIEDPRRL